MMTRPTPERLQYIRIHKDAPMIGNLLDEIDALIAERVVCLKCHRSLAPDGDCHGCRADRLEVTCAEMRILLQEWLATPFFETHGAWVNWVREFRPRVEAILAESTQVQPPPAGE